MMKTLSRRIAEAYENELIEGTIYRIDMDHVDVIPLSSTGILRSLPLTGDRDKVQVGDPVRIVRVGGKRVALAGDLALWFDVAEDTTEPATGITPVELEGAITDREATRLGSLQQDADGNVGIRCAPDPQFSLDVYGNIRASGYIVGKHALQVSGAKLIAHFDGPEPYVTDATGDPNGHMGQIGTLTGATDFRAGKFGKALHFAATGSLVYQQPTAIDFTQPGTLCFWRKLEVGDSSLAGGKWIWSGSEPTETPTDYFALAYSADALGVELHISSASATSEVFSAALPVDTLFHHYAVTWNDTSAALYLDGMFQFSVAYTPMTANPAALGLGYSMSTIDDLAILGVAMSADEIRAIYQSNAPLFAETSNWSFRSPNSRTWSDADGLWSVSSAGNPAFGVSGVDGKTWGGLPLDSGDVLIGRGSNYVKWDDSSGTLVFAGNGSGITNINGANITTGYISAARINAGTITAAMLAATALDAKTITGSTIRTSVANPRIEMNSSGLKGYDASGTAQAYFSSDGKFYAGGGKVHLDANGIYVDAPNTLPTAAQAASYRFNSAIGVIGGLYGYHSGSQHMLVLQSEAVGTNTGQLQLNSIGPTNTYGQVSIAAQCGLNSSYISLQQSNSPTGGNIQIAANYVAVNGNMGVSGAFSAATLQLTYASALWDKISDKPIATGSFTPAWVNMGGSGTLATNTGHYYRIGDLWHVQIQLQSSGNKISTFGTTYCTLPSPIPWPSTDAVSPLWNPSDFTTQGYAVIRQGKLYLPTFNLTTKWLSVNFVYRT